MLERVWRLMVLCLVLAGPVRAQGQEVVFVQVEARNTIEGAIESAQDYVARDVPDVNGFSLGTGWFALALGPYERSDAEEVLRVYRAEGVIPRDSFIAFPSAYRQQFWPAGENILGRGVLQLTPSPVETEETAERPVAEAPAPLPEPDARPEPDETPREARASERTLNAEERRELQRALAWAGTYSAGIDGAFGRGTRNAMALWQEQNNFEATGVLTTLQRAELLRQFNAVFDDVGFEVVPDIQAGISMKMPTELVRFGGHIAPFARYDSSGKLPGVRVILISQAGDQDRLFGLYDIMQTLEIVPLDGPRERRSNSFSITGENDEIISQTEVWLREGEIKGFVLIWPTGDEARRIRILEEMRKSFTRIEGVLPVETSLEEDQQSVDLLAGLEIRRPRVSRSGFFVDTDGTVVTTSEAVGGCTRLTLDQETEAELLAEDSRTGIAVLRPRDAITPRGVARFAVRQPKLQSEVAVAGFSFEGVLGAPSMTFGEIRDLRGLGGETQLRRLALSALPGDAGGPVFDASGGVLGMLLPRRDGVRALPEDVNFATDAAAIQEVLQQAGVSGAQADAASTLDPIDLTSAAQAMTVLVSCWD